MGTKANGKVVVLTTGGTIAMRYDAAAGGSVPAVNGAELVAAVPPLAGICDIEVREFSNVPSPHITPALMLRLGQTAEEILAGRDVLGLVITHGTDTLEETAFFLDLYTRGEKPICLTAAMRNAADLSCDGPHNILCAVRTAASAGARGKGVLVVMNEEIHAAVEVTKIHSANPGAFDSPSWGPLGYVDEDQVIIHRESLCRQNIHPERIEEDVHLVKMAAGMDDFFFRCLIEKKARGIVVEALGRGNVPPAAFAGIREAIAGHIPVVLTSRCPGGRVLGVYAYEGGGRQLLEAGAISAGELNGQKARLKLMLALGVTGDPQKLAELFKSQG
jgi:L-asparaginase